eukprot:CAMPEP_0181110780 /NCGR_PEP_ID=MMETSP1071-20121207/18905_1 /TAXON_ID=35127 /ORGANISM="Thalassiosira sp., Strain NH16" /LENGTH=165 /DNA_ID=CAMNT_0023194591 /DNA_START=297 /DNA_END=794 /DNA_ORIENTATION=+
MAPVIKYMHTNAWIIACEKYSLLAVLLALPHTLAHLFFERRLIISPLYRSIQIRRAFIIGIREHGNDRHENLLHAEDGSPPLLRRLAAVVRILPRIVQNGDANLAVLVDVRMPHFRLEGHFGRFIREVFGEDKAGLEEAALEEGAVGTHDEDFPVVDVAFIGQPH